jgi:predicted Zn finger-like uncharacterized protein
MIINCENCNKKFNLDNNLIGENGRLLKCGKCNHTWFFKPHQKLEEEIVPNDDLNKLSLQEKQKINIKINDTDNGKSKKKVKKNNILNYFIVILISLISLILIADTFKEHFSIIAPSINPLLENLYESLYDLQLFLKDLIS